MQLSAVRRSATERVLFVRSFVKAVLFAVTGFARDDDRDGRGVVVVALVRVREWLGRRAGVSGCEPAALASESFPGCPPGPAFARGLARPASATIVM